MTEMPNSVGRSGMRMDLSAVERRRHRRHVLEAQGVTAGKWEAKKHTPEPVGQVVDLSAGGIRIRTDRPAFKADQQLRLRLELPAYAGISPFIDTSTGSARPKNQWDGWMAVSRVQPLPDGQYDVCGRLMDMEEIDQGMLKLYLSAQPMAA